MDNTPAIEGRKLRRHLWVAEALSRVRPTALVDPLYRLLRGCRYVVAYRGIRLWITPYSHLGRSVLEGAYEPGTEDELRSHLVPGGVFVDVGANEGFYCAFASQALGPEGTIIAFEPQSALGPVIRRNVALNGDGRLILHRAVASDTPGQTVELNIFPASNHGASSVVRRYRYSSRTESVQTTTVDRAVAEAGCETVDLLKIDVEGFEKEVVGGMTELLAARRIRTILLDYHEPILRSRGIDGAEIDAVIRGAGYDCVQGDWRGGYAVYQPSA